MSTHTATIGATRTSLSNAGAVVSVLPKNVVCSARNMYTAPTTTPKAQIAVATNESSCCASNTAKNTNNSATKVAEPGNPQAQTVNTENPNPKRGRATATPES